MKRFIRIVAIICVAVMLLMSMIGCGYRYRKKYKAAYTLFYSQVPGTMGARFFIFLSLAPQIILLETDSMGRELYLYYEDPEGLLSIGIVQKETDDHVYFYPEQSTLSFWMPDYMYDYDDKKVKENDLIDLLHDLCSNDTLENFKSDNDWNMPINESKLDCVEIDIPRLRATTFHGRDIRVDSVNLSRDEWLQQIILFAEKNGYTKNEEYRGYFDHSLWMATDDYGRRLYYVEGNYYMPSYNKQIDSIEYLWQIVAIINPDGSFNSETFMVELEDKANYQEQIRDLKIANNWNKPFN